MDNMQTDLRHVGRIPQETVNYLISKKFSKTKADQKRMWFCADMIFIASECLALAIFFIPHNWSGFQFHARALIILPLLAMPWLLGRGSLRKYKLVGEPTIPANVRADFSYRLALLVIFAYALFMAGITTALK